LASVLEPFHGLLFTDHKKKTFPLSQFIVRDSLKLSSLESDMVGAFSALYPVILNQVSLVSSQNMNRTVIGR